MRLIKTHRERLFRLSAISAICVMAAACGGGGAASPLTPSPSAPAPEPEPAIEPQAPAGYHLVWREEFSVSNSGLPDDSIWSYDTEANKKGWYNDELQYYAAGRKENSEVRDGILRITARKESLSDKDDWGGQAYSSARLITRDKASFKYGWFEVRAKVPCGIGTWPAIWMLGVDGDWPNNGEIDIMEHVGKNPKEIVGTIHNGSTINTPGISGTLRVEDACSAFHNYQIEWTSSQIEFFVDGKSYHIYKNKNQGLAQWPYDQPMYLLLNMAVGGEMTGPVVDSDLPRTFEVDYVRVFQKTP